MARELQSLSDGQVVLDSQAAAAGEFPALVPGATFSRFGLGSAGSPSEALPVGEEAIRQRRDVRPAALQAVAAHLRTELALEREARFRPVSGEVDGAQSKWMRAVRAAMLQPPRTPLLPAEMAALLLVACSGALDPLGDVEAAAALQGGSTSPLVQHLNQAAPHVLQKLAEQEGQLPTAALRELEVAARLFVELRKAALLARSAGGKAA